MRIWGRERTVSGYQRGGDSDCSNAPSDLVCDQLLVGLSACELDSHSLADRHLLARSTLAFEPGATSSFSLTR